MSKTFEYYSNWRNEVVTCPNCAWQGRVDDGNQRYFHELLDSCCPQCGRIVAIVMYPTNDNVRAAAQAGHPEAIRNLAGVERMEARWERFDREKLKTPDQLPNLWGKDDLDFVLDTDDERTPDRERESFNLLKYGDRVIWKELAFWEGWQRYPELVEILKAKYGSRFKSLKVTYKAHQYLFGDILTPPIKVDISRRITGQ